MNAVTAVNALLALGAFLLTVGTVNRMNGVTSNPLRMAVIMISIGLLAQWLGVITGQWNHYADTILYCGIASLMVADRRNPCGIPKRLQAPIVYTTAGVAVMSLFIMVTG